MSLNFDLEYPNKWISRFRQQFPSKYLFIITFFCATNSTSFHNFRFRTFIILLQKWKKSHCFSYFAVMLSVVLSTISSMEALSFQSSLPAMLNIMVVLPTGHAAILRCSVRSTTPIYFTASSWIWSIMDSATSPKWSSSHTPEHATWTTGKVSFRVGPTTSAL